MPVHRSSAARGLSWVPWPMVIGTPNHDQPISLLDACKGFLVNHCQVVSNVTTGSSITLGLEWEEILHYIPLPPSIKWELSDLGSKSDFCPKLPKKENSLDSGNSSSSLKDTKSVSHKEVVTKKEGILLINPLMFLPQFWQDSVNFVEFARAILLFTFFAEDVWE